MQHGAEEKNITEFLLCMTMIRIKAIYMSRRASFLMDLKKSCYIFYEKSIIRKRIAPTAPLAASTQTSQLKNPVAPAAEGLPILAPLALANLLT